MEVFLDSPGTEAGEAERTALGKTDMENFLNWDDRLYARTPHVFAYNKFLSENAVQWGHRPGVNSGVGQIEAVIPADVVLALCQPGARFADDPDWWKDDRKFYGYLREHPGLDSRPNRHRS